MKTYIKITTLFLLITLCFQQEATAQQEAQYSMYMFNPLSINPAYTGSKNALDITLLHRSQWVGIEGAPKTQTLSIQSPLKGRPIALGLSVYNDAIGANKNTGVYVDFAYNIPVNKQGSRLAFGLKGGMDFFSSDLKEQTVIDDTDDTYNNGSYSHQLPNFGFGVFYYGKRHYVGLAIPRLLENSIVPNNSESVQHRHFYAMAGYVFRLSSTLDFKPSVNLKQVKGAPLSADFNASLLFYDWIWFGAMYRTGGVLGANIMINITKSLRFGYAYDYTTNAINDFNSGSHEIMLGFDLSSKTHSYTSPRYF